MSKHTKYRYTCRNCRKEFYLEKAPESCPDCKCTNSIYKGTLKSLECAEHNIAIIKTIIPEMDKRMEEFSEIYSLYCTCREVIRAYEMRGIIPKGACPIYKLPSLTENFYKSRKKK